MSAATGASPASAATQPWTQAEYDAEFLKIMRANGMASDPVAQAEAVLADAAERGAKPARRLLGGLSRLRAAVRVTPKGLGVIGLGALALDLGFRYGPDLWQSITADPEPAVDVEEGYAPAPSILWVEVDDEAFWWQGCIGSGHTWPTNAAGAGEIPDGAWVVSSSKADPPTGTRPHVCNAWPLEGPPAGQFPANQEANLKTIVATANRLMELEGVEAWKHPTKCRSGNSLWGYWYYDCFILYRPSEAMDEKLARGAVVPFDGQTASVVFDGSSHVPNPSDSDVLTRARTYLSDPANADVERYVSWLLDPPNNPMPDGLKVVIPHPNPGETASAYLARLNMLGLVGSIQVSDEADPRFGPDAVTGVSPAPGSAVAPAPLGEPVRIRANPSTAPDPVQSVPGQEAGGCTPWVEPEIRLGAWDLPSDRFPFALLPWVRDGFTSSSGVAPSFDIPIGGETLHVDLAVAEPAMAVLRPTIAACALLSLVWWLGTSLMGLRAKESD